MIDGDSVTAAFEAAYGDQPEGVWAAPGRVNLIGEHTDYNDGFVLPLAIDRRAAVAVGRRRDAVIRVTSSQFGSATVPLGDVAPGRVTGWPAYVVGPVWSLRAEGIDIGGLDIYLDSDVPVGSGLSSSAAIECAVATAVADLAGSSVDRQVLALAAQRAEVEVVGMPCGVMDQMVSMLATDAHALFLDTRSLESEQIPLPLREQQRTLLVIDTKAPHRLVDGAYAQRRAACHRAAEALGVPALRDVTIDDVHAAAESLGDVAYRRARHVVSENERVLAVAQLLRDGQLDAIGPLLTASHVSLRDDFEVTVPELDVAVEAALGAGALGARMTGGGFGGCIIALVHEDASEVIVEAVQQAFATQSFTAPQAFAAVPSRGAARLS